MTCGMNSFEDGLTGVLKLLGDEALTCDMLPTDESGIIERVAP